VGLWRFGEGGAGWVWAGVGSGFPSGMTDRKARAIGRDGNFASDCGYISIAAFAGAGGDGYASHGGPVAGDAV